MSDSDSDMPEAISFSTAKKTVNAKQKELNKAAQAAITQSKKKKVRKVVDEFDGDEEDIEVQAQVPRKKVKSEAAPVRSLNAKVDANLMSMINEELPQKKMKQLEGKFQVTERTKSSKKSENGPKLLTLSQDVSKASKNLGSGVQIVFSKIAKPVIPVNTSATDFLAARNNLSNAKRQPISRIISRK